MNTFEALLELQDLDQGLLRQRQSYSQISVDLQERAQRLMNLRDKCERAKRSQVQAEVAMKRLELERASENQGRAEVEERLYSGTDNSRDYYRLGMRAQEHANRIDAIDERMEPIREAANEARQVHSDLQTQLDQMEADWAEKKQLGTDEQTRISQEYNEALKHRNETAGAIPEKHLGEYTRLFKSNGGMAVTVVERDICAGCSERVSMGELNVLKHATDPILCHCGKYLITLSSD